MLDCEIRSKALQYAQALHYRRLKNYIGLHPPKLTMKELLDDASDIFYYLKGTTSFWYNGQVIKRMDVIEKALNWPPEQKQLNTARELISLAEQFDNFMES